MPNIADKKFYEEIVFLRFQAFKRFLCLGKAAKEAEANLRKQRRMMRTHILKHMVIGARVVRGLDWKWRDQDGTPPGEGRSNC